VATEAAWLRAKDPFKKNQNRLDSHRPSHGRTWQSDLVFRIGKSWNPGEPQVNYSQFETIQKIKKSAAAIRKEEKELAKSEKTLAEKQLLVQRLGLDENVEAPTARASAEAVNSLRAKIAEMKAKHNKFVQENGLRLELFPE
jgi:hypothetical protein